MANNFNDTILISIYTNLVFYMPWFWLPCQIKCCFHAQNYLQTACVKCWLCWSWGQMCFWNPPPLLNHVKSLTACERNWKLKWVFNDGMGEREVMGTLRWRQQMALLCLDFEGIAKTLVWPVTLFFSWYLKNVWNSHMGK